jgi:5'(3')-deoxyribonucleotidase
MKKQSVVYIDMDDTIADFWSEARDPKTGDIREHMMWDKDFFLNLKPIAGAKGAIFEIEKMGYDIYILSQPLAESPESYIDKVKWIQIHFPQLYKKIILTQDKGLCLGDYLIDDNDTKWKEKFEKNGGTFVHFPYGGHTYAKDPTLCRDPEQAWRDIVSYLRAQPK